jgi:predicted alpha/beta superfamily hydrolase
VFCVDRVMKATWSRVGVLAMPLSIVNAGLAQLHRYIGGHQKYPTLYMLDGKNAFDQCTAFKGEQELQLDETVTHLIAARKIAQGDAAKRKVRAQSPLPMKQPRDNTGGSAFLHCDSL